LKKYGVDRPDLVTKLPNFSTPWVMQNWMNSPRKSGPGDEV
jgi:hypothetical protein